MSNHAAKQNMSVFVINKRGITLMPCSPTKARSYFDVRKLDGIRISAGISYKKLTLLEKRRSFLTNIIKQDTLSHVLKDKVSA